MSTVFFYIGKGLQLLGMGTVMLAFIMFFKDPDMGAMFKLTFFGLVEFYLGYFLVSSTGVK